MFAPYQIAIKLDLCELSHRAKHDKPVILNGSKRVGRKKSENINSTKLLIDFGLTTFFSSAH